MTSNQEIQEEKLVLDLGNYFDYCAVMRIRPKVGVVKDIINAYIARKIRQVIGMIDIGYTDVGYKGKEKEIFCHSQRKAKQGLAKNQDKWIKILIKMERRPRYKSKTRQIR